MAATAASPSGDIESPSPSPPTAPTPASYYARSRATSTHSSSRKKKKRTEFLLPSGRRIVVALPSDVDRLRRRYLSHPDAPSPPPVEVVLHGSPEHLHFLSVSQAHHAARHEELRARVGHETAEELERVRAELRAVEGHLKRVERGMVVGGDLGASFGKFGFDAQLRTYGGGGEEGSETEGEGDGEGSSWGGSTAAGPGAEAGRDGLKVFRRPVVKQYFHRGLLWRSSEQTEVMSFELFFDLLYGEFSAGEGGLGDC
jgi:hypothetical protein